MPVETLTNSVQTDSAGTATVHAVAPKHARFPALDGLRGTAFLLILLCHSHDVLWADSHSPVHVQVFDKLLLWAGGYALDLFFVLSAFLITGILLKTKDSPDYFKNFYAKRALRLLPAYYLLLLVVFAGSFFIQHGVGDATHWFFLIVNFVNVIQTIENKWSFGPASHCWSLALEEQFYLVWSVLVKYLNQRSLSAICISGFVAAPFLRYVMRHCFHNIIFPHEFRLDGLFVGALLCFAMQRRSVEQLQKPASIVLFFSAIAAVIAIISLPLEHEMRRVVLPTICSVTGGALLVKAIGQSYIKQFFDMQALKTVGLYSYGMFLFHWPIVRVIEPYWHLNFLPIEISWALFLVLVFALTAGISVISFKFVEMPALRLKHLFQ